MSIVEETLKSQRRYWKEITKSILFDESGLLPHQKPKRILLFGLGSSHFAARLTAYSLVSDEEWGRIPIFACPSSSIGHEVIPMPGDWAIAFTHRGGEGLTSAALGRCGRAGAFCLAITGREVGDMTSARITIRTTPLEKVEPHTASVTGALCAANLLFLNEKMSDFWNALADAPDPDLTVLRETVGNGPTVILGEWEGEWMAKEAALKMMEMARLPVRAFGSEEFFHGPKFSLKSDDVLWHVCVSGDPRTDKISAAKRFEIGNGGPLAWMATFIELQWAALAVALNRGIDPDSAGV